MRLAIQLLVSLIFGSGMATVIGAQLPAALSSEGDLRAEFDKRFGAWLHKIDTDFRVHSNTFIYLRCQEYTNLMELGIGIVPFLVEKMAECEDAHPGLENPLKVSIQRFARRNFRITDTPKEWTPEVLAWWKSRGEAPTVFRAERARWNQAKAKGVHVLEVQTTSFDDRTKIVELKREKTELGKAYDSIRQLGVDALPLIIEELKSGEYDLLPLFGDVTDGVGITQGGPLQGRAQVTLEWWEARKKDWLLPPVSAAKLKEPKP